MILNFNINRDIFNDINRDQRNKKNLYIHKYLKLKIYLLNFNK